LTLESQIDLTPRPPGYGPCTGATGTWNTIAANLSIPPESKDLLDYRDDRADPTFWG